MSTSDDKATAEYVGGIDENYEMFINQDEPIVRCRDCLNFEQDELGDYCTLLDFEDVKSMENKFCAWGDAK